MILLDTNVVSELMRSGSAREVLDWFRRNDAANLFVTAVTKAELRAGAALLPEGQRRDRAQRAIDDMIEQDFRGRVLPFDTLAARPFADVAAQRRAAGRPIATADGQIAAIALARGATIATRNVRDFDGCGVAVVDPWASDGLA